MRLKVGGMTEPCRIPRSTMRSRRERSRSAESSAGLVRQRGIQSDDHRRMARESRDELENLHVAGDRNLLRENNRVPVARQHHSARAAGVRGPGKVDANDADRSHGSRLRYLVRCDELPTASNVASRHLLRQPSGRDRLQCAPSTAPGPADLAHLSGVRWSGCEGVFPAASRKSTFTGTAYTTAIGFPWRRAGLKRQVNTASRTQASTAGWSPL